MKVRNVAAGIALSLMAANASAADQSLYEMGKTVGVEFNPVGLMLMGTGVTYLSGGVSFFSLHPDIEFAVPVAYGSLNFDDDVTEDSASLSNISVDPQIRYYADNQQGSFVMLTGRYARLAAEGTSCDYYSSDCEEASGYISRAGLGFGAGVRNVTNSGLYWGSSFTFGRYLMGSVSDSELETDLADMSAFYWDVEFMKIGFSF